MWKASKARGSMLGAAYGDALGWPNERVGKSKVTPPTKGRLYDFKSWIRHSGGRFFPHEETIGAGEYSDDTQLILCLSRSLLKGEAWWDYFTQVELPFWSVYERGGGGATKRAVDSWLDGVAPWSPDRKPQDVKRYFEAGGNGVAMRVLPHILRLGGKEFPEISANIFLDGVTTHGHPRALLGAQAYGFALWAAFRKEPKMAYGELVEDLIKNAEVWSAAPTSKDILPEWKNQAERYTPDYPSLWELAKVEILEYLEVCRTELAKGALSFDDEVLKKLQCFSKISGAGTVTGVAAIYLASRHAADPINGVVKAAFAIGSDTDTIASMTGGLLGCINGSDWLSPVRQGIQDASYIESCASRLADEKTDEHPKVEPVRRSNLKNWIDAMAVAQGLKGTRLPDLRLAKISHAPVVVGRSGKFKVEFLKFLSEDGQSIYVNKISKGDFQTNPTQKQTAINLEGSTSEIKRQSFLSQERLSFGPKLPVASLEKSAKFYKAILGFSIKRQTQEVVVFHQGLVLAPVHYTKDFPCKEFRALLYTEVEDISKIFDVVMEFGNPIVTKLENWGQSTRRFFRCLDPDGNVIEVFERQ